MTILSTVGAFLRALTAYFELKVVTDLDDRIEKKRRKIREYARTIDKHRSNGTPASQQLADQLRLELDEERSSLEHLLARRSSPDTERDGSD